jgi:hypothetical protein
MIERHILDLIRQIDIMRYLEPKKFNNILTKIYGLVLARLFITLMRIRIRLITLMRIGTRIRILIFLFLQIRMRIWIRIFTLMRIRILDETLEKVLK